MTYREKLREVLSDGFYQKVVNASVKSGLGNRLDEDFYEVYASSFINHLICWDRTDEGASFWMACYDSIAELNTDPNFNYHNKKTRKLFR
jgi:hypothetical protein